MKLNLEDERRELAECLKLRETVNEPIHGELEARRKLVHALEQLEQAREVMKYAELVCKEGGWLASLQAAVDKFEALKQQEVGNE